MEKNKFQFGKLTIVDQSAQNSNFENFCNNLLKKLFVLIINKENRMSGLFYSYENENNVTKTKPNWKRLFIYLQLKNTLTFFWHLITNVVYSFMIQSDV